MHVDGRRATGALGERLAEAHLTREGYRVLERNARTRHGELDLVVVGHGCLVFCEVRARVAAAGGAGRGAYDAAGPLESIGPQKRRRLRQLAREWLAARCASAEGDGEDLPSGVRRLRFDAVGIILSRDGTLLDLEHVEDAF